MDFLLVLLLGTFFSFFALVGVPEESRRAASVIGDLLREVV
jgi:hypothetical protein